MTTDDEVAHPRLIVDLHEIRVRLQCQCGAAVSVRPADLSENLGVLQCPNCNNPWPGYEGTAQTGGLVTKFVKTLRDLVHDNDLTTNGYHVQVEVEFS